MYLMLKMNFGRIKSVGRIVRMKKYDTILTKCHNRKRKTVAKCSCLFFLNI